MGSMPMRKRLQRPFGCRLRRRSGRAAVQPHPPLRRCAAPPLPCRGGELSRLLLQRALRLGDDRGKRLALVHRDVGEHFAVETDAGEVQRVDELAVGEALGADRGVDPLDPQSAEAALLHLAVAVGILPSLLDRLAGYPDRVLAAAVIALRLIQDPFVLGAAGYAAFDACHVLSAPYLRP